MYNSKDQTRWKRGEITHTKLPEYESFNKICIRKQIVNLFGVLTSYDICYRKINTNIKHQLFTLQFFVESRRLVLSNWGSEAKRRPVSPLKARLWDILTDFSVWNWKVVWLRRISWAVCSVLSVYWVARVCFSQMADRLLPRICTQQRDAKVK